MNDEHIVAVLGASKKKQRYSNKAILMLLEHGYEPIPVNPAFEIIENIKTAKSLKDIKKHIDTLTVYIGPKNISSLIDDIISVKPGRVILNPGTESEELIKRLDQEKIRYIQACTLVLIKTGQFESVWNISNKK